MSLSVENNAAFLLSICYGIQQDVAVRMTACRGQRKVQEELVAKEVSKFFDNGKYNIRKNVFLDYAEKGMKVKDIAKKYEIDQLTVRRYLDSCESHYLEFKGLIELGMLDHYDNPELMSFLTRYGRFHVSEQKKKQENYKWYQEYLAGNITKTFLERTTHMSTKTLCNI